jgi:hypothetical protein
LKPFVSLSTSMGPCLSIHQGPAFDELSCPREAAPETSNAATPNTATHRVRRPRVRVRVPTSLSLFARVENIMSIFFCRILSR